MGGLSVGYVFMVKDKSSRVTIYLNSFIFLLYITSLLLFIFGLSIYSSDYDVAISLNESEYTPFSNAHFLSLFVFYWFSIIGMFNLWKKGRKLPPLLLVT
jgi:hypothetical protein